MKENNRNSFFKWDLKDIYQQLEFLNYRFLLLTRNAGQGKTNFLCDYTENFIMKNSQALNCEYYHKAKPCIPAGCKLILIYFLYIEKLRFLKSAWTGFLNRRCPRKKVKEVSFMCLGISVSSSSKYL